MADQGSGAAGGGIAPIAGAAALGAVLVAGAVAFVALRDDAVPPEDAAQAVVSAPADVQPEPAEPRAESPEAPDVPAADPAVPAPRFDVVRVDPAGNAVIAGQAGQGARVTLSIDGDPVEEIEADASGNFVAMLALAPSETPRILSLEAAQSGGEVVAGDETVIIAPFAGETVAMASGAPAEPPAAAPGVEPAQSAAAPAPEAPEEAAATPPEAIASEGATPPEPPPVLRTDRPGVGEATSTSPDTPDAVAGTEAGGAGTLPDATLGAAPAAETASAAPPAETPAGPVAAPEAPAAPATDAATALADLSQPDLPQAAPEAPAVLMSDGDGLRVLQAPGGPPSAQTEIQLDAITYDVEGDVTLAGRGPADASVRVTLNNEPINMGEIGPGGQWSLGLPDVDPGTYTLRLEQLSADGTVTRSVETPFLREDPARIRDNPMLVDPGASVITVQRGFTLWGIAEANFGDGILYVQIFEENRGEIRDPDLIFPGQIFALPDLPRAAGDE